jgi:hypothetical protein
MGAKSQNLIATAILISVVMLAYTAEAAPNFGNKQIVSRVITRVERHSTNIASYMSCAAYNKSPTWLCAVYDVYPAWFLSPRPVHGTVYSMLPPNTDAWTQVYAVAINLFQKQPLQCKLRYTVYRPPYSFCP